MVLNIEPDPDELNNAIQLIGAKCYVDYPYPKEAIVSAVSTATEKCILHSCSVLQLNLLRY
jgi:hypothetical protein